MTKIDFDFNAVVEHEAKESLREFELPITDEYIDMIKDAMVQGIRDEARSIAESEL